MALEPLEKPEEDRFPPLAPLANCLRTIEGRVQAKGHARVHLPGATMFPSTPFQGIDVLAAPRAEQAEDANLSVEVSPVQVGFCVPPGGV